MSHVWQGFRIAITPAARQALALKCRLDREARGGSSRCASCAESASETGAPLAPTFELGPASESAGCPVDLGPEVDDVDAFPGPALDVQPGPVTGFSVPAHDGLVFVIRERAIP